MSAHRTADTGPVSLPLGKRWVRRLAPLAFVAVVAAAAGLTILHPRGRAVPAPPSPQGMTSFSHTYPADPLVPERPPVTGPDPVAPPRTTISSPVVITSLAGLADALPSGTMVRLGHRDWMLSRPASISGHAVLHVTGRRTLRIGPGAFLSAGTGGSIVLRDLRIIGVDAAGRPKPRAVPGRGFLATTAGGRLRLEHDRLADLGFLGRLAYGVSFRRPRPGSGILDSVVSGNYFGAYLSAARGVAIIGNRFSRSVVYGIDPHTFSSHLVIRHNVVVSSGEHGIILAQGVHDSVVSDNVVRGATLHGIVLDEHSDRNRISGNHVSGTFDGIVVQDSSSNLVLGNVVDGAGRFALRVSGASTSNLITSNTLSSALVGAYVYAGPTGNSLIDDTFAGSRENVRIRGDAPGNVVIPLPPNSEVPPS